MRHYQISRRVDKPRTHSRTKTVQTAGYHVKYTFLEFFAGGGMARAGLGPNWTCLFANDWDAKKLGIYRENWGLDNVHLGDIAAITDKPLQGTADLAWASFPCQDLSVAGNGEGLNGARSGAFWPFWRLLAKLAHTGRAPRSIVLENVCGALASNGGEDFAMICRAIADNGYLAGAVVINARNFVPQSRPRVFIIAVRKDLPIPAAVAISEPAPYWHPPSLLAAHAKFSEDIRESWLWWQLPIPNSCSMSLADIIETDPKDIAWNSYERTSALLSMMSDVNRAKVVEAGSMGKPVVGTVYKRTRHVDGQRIQRAEVRFDGVAGCLRTPAGGSSRQIIIMVDGNEVRTRLISSRELARLMGLPDSYRLPENYNDAYRLLGDGVVAPVVRYLAANVLEPVLDARHLDLAA